MKLRKTAESIAWLLPSVLLVLSQIAAPLTAQTRKPPAAPPKPAAKPVPKEAVPTFDTLLAAESYKIYGEVRGVGQLIRSAGVNDLLDPIIKLTGPPKEFRTIIKWLNTHAGAVMTSRMMFASWPTRAKVPQFLCAIEFESAEEALKFEPQLRAFLPKVLPTPEPSPVASPVAGASKSEGAPAATKPSEPTVLPYLIKRSGSLVLVADSPFTFKNLRPAGSKLLGEQQNFRLARDRFTSESIFIYFDVGLEDQSVPKPSLSPTIMIGNEATESERQEELAQLQQMDTTITAPEDPPAPQVPDASAATLDTNPSKSQTSQDAIRVGTPSGASTPTPASSMALFSLMRVLFGGEPNWPEAVGAAVIFENDSYVIRTLLVNSPEKRASSIPFIPHLVSGPALVPAAPSILPADTELFIAASLDYPQVYDGIVRAMAGLDEEIRRNTRQPSKESQPESPLAAYEKRLGIKFKDDLIPLLGNEIAVSVPVKALYGPPSSPPKDEQTDGGSTQKGLPPSAASPLIAIAIKDREAISVLIPKLIDSMGLNSASLLAETEKRDDTELVSYADVISYAFVDDFLVLSLDTAAVRHVVDAYLKHETLASDSHFRNSTRWQPHQVLGQVYVSPALMETYNSFTRIMTGSGNEKLRDFVSGLSPTPEPVTYALSNEGMGPLHELHIPKDLVMLMVAGISGESEQSSLGVNEAVAQSSLRTIASAQATFQATEGDGHFASLDELVSAGLVSKEAFARNGYRIEVTASGKEFEASAVPHEYGKTGKMSYFLDQTSVLRGGDHGGGPATISDKPVQ